jgi:hypothetical protein
VCFSLFVCVCVCGSVFMCVCVHVCDKKRGGEYSLCMCMCPHDEIVCLSIHTCESVCPPSSPEDHPHSSSFPC